MKLKIFSILIVFLNLVNCSNKEQNKEHSNMSDKAISDLILNYNNSGNIKYLEEAYLILNNNEFKKNGLTKNNHRDIISILFNLKKYDELESLLSPFEEMNHFEKIKLLNTIRGLNVEKYNPFETVNFFYENINLINDSIQKSPNDSLLYVDYFVNRMFIVGKKKTITEIDSMKNKSNKFSDIFYDYILKDMIKSYPTDKLPSHLIDEE